MNSGAFFSSELQMITIYDSLFWCCWIIAHLLTHQLIKMLRQWVDVSGNALDWFFSHLAGFLSRLITTSETTLSCGLLHGSLLASLILSCISFPLGRTRRPSKVVSYHCYADDKQ